MPNTNSTIHSHPSIHGRGRHSRKSSHNLDDHSPLSRHSSASGSDAVEEIIHSVHSSGPGPSHSPAGKHKKVKGGKMKRLQKAAKLLFIRGGSKLNEQNVEKEPECVSDGDQMAIDEDSSKEKQDWHANSVLGAYKNRQIVVTHSEPNFVVNFNRRASVPEPNSPKINHKKVIVHQSQRNLVSQTSSTTNLSAQNRISNLFSSSSQEQQSKLSLSPSDVNNDGIDDHKTSSYLSPVPVPSTLFIPGTGPLSPERTFCDDNFNGVPLKHAKTFDVISSYPALISSKAKEKLKLRFPFRSHKKNDDSIAERSDKAINESSSKQKSIPSFQQIPLERFGTIEPNKGAFKASLDYRMNRQQEKQSSFTIHSFGTGNKETSKKKSRGLGNLLGASGADYSPGGVRERMVNGLGLLPHESEDEDNKLELSTIFEDPNTRKLKNDRRFESNTDDDDDERRVEESVKTAPSSVMRDAVAILGLESKPKNRKSPNNTLLELFEESSK